jgi:hypothetical protein
MFRSPATAHLQTPKAAAEDAIPVHEPPLSPLDEVIFLLNIAAEIEHSLMVQYLFAAYSLKPADQVTEEDRKALLRQSRGQIITVAREEMGHLVTVQNLLRAVGAPLSLNRDEFPLDSGFFPFAFRLERLTTDSIAKYAFAEMPPPEVAKGINGVSEEEIDDITKRASTDNLGQPVNRVGKLYEQLIGQVQSLPASAFDKGSVAQQAKFDEWGLGRDDIFVLPVGSRADAVAALQKIAEQGEGPLTADAASDPDSHFQRFLAIYRQLRHGGNWSPSFETIEEPNVRTAPSPGQITHAEAKLWAQLFNARYRRLLITLRHALEIESAPPGGTNVTPRGLLISWVFSEMYQVRSIAEMLVTLPAKDPPGDARAAAPFEMPSSLSLPTAEKNRWRMQASILQSADIIARSLINLPATRSVDFLHGMLTADAEAIQIASKVASP